MLPHFSERPKIVWFIGDYKGTRIVGSNGLVVNAESKDFDSFACIQKKDLEVLMKYIIKLERDYE